MNKSPASLIYLLIDFTLMHFSQYNNQPYFSVPIAVHLLLSLLVVNVSGLFRFGFYVHFSVG